ncbi:hypothetical protein F5051DRAFT_428287 [Lentinula edodes]|nr:hypothetical protein F5051DRAFT_428287 [Lentinula edodes]
MSDLELASCVYSMQCGAEGHDMWLRLGCPSDDLTKRATTRPTWYQIYSRFFTGAKPIRWSVNHFESFSCFPLLALKLSSVYQLHLTRLSMMYFYRLISALAFVSMVLAAAVPSPGSPTADGPQLLSKNGATIEVTFPGHSADSKWTETTQNDAQVGVIKLLREARKKSLQNVKSKDVKFHGFVSGASADRHSFEVKFSGALADIGDCTGWVTVDLRDHPGTEVAIVSGDIKRNVVTMPLLSHWITIGYYRWKEVVTMD